MDAPNGLTCCIGSRVHAVLAHPIFESNIDWDLGFHIAQLFNVALYLASPIICAGSNAKVFPVLCDFQIDPHEACCKYMFFRHSKDKYPYPSSA